MTKQQGQRPCKLSKTYQFNVIPKSLYSKSSVLGSHSKSVAVNSSR